MEVREKTMSRYVFGIDVGGTTVKCGLFDLEGNVLDKWEVPTRKKDGCLLYTSRCV